MSAHFRAGKSGDTKRMKYVYYDEINDVYYEGRGELANYEKVDSYIGRKVKIQTFGIISPDCSLFFGIISPDCSLFIDLLDSVASELVDSSALLFGSRRSLIEVKIHFIYKTTRTIVNAMNTILNIINNVK